MHLKTSTDRLSGIFFAMLGGVSMAIAARYHIGTAARMGPGYFPMMVGIILVFLGGGLIIISFVNQDESIGRIGFRQIFCIVFAIGAFALLIESGLVTATLAAVLIASFARPIENWIEASIVAAVLAGFAAIVFVYGLGLPMRLLPF